MDWLMALIGITIVGLIIVWCIYCGATEEIIKSQEREIKMLRRRLKNYERRM